ncbi:hypothetical protein ABBQ32_002497 [Trebouxia sp. C0010 RCD-2024]
MYGETGYHGAYAASNPEASNGMHRSPGQGSYQGKFGQASFNTDDQHSVDEPNHPAGMSAAHVNEATCAYQGRFGTMPAAKMFEPQHSGELERKGSAYHGHFGQ